MAEIRFVISDSKTGKSYQKVLDNDNPYLNTRIGDKVEGSALGLDGYRLEIRGGSDKSGCPIRWDMPGFGKKKALLSSGPCIHISRKDNGKRVKKTVVGNLINQDIVQLNLKVLEYGSKSLDEMLPKKVESKEATAN